MGDSRRLPEPCPEVRGARSGPGAENAPVRAADGSQEVRAGFQPVVGAQCRSRQPGRGGREAPPPESALPSFRDWGGSNSKTASPKDRGRNCLLHARKLYQRCLPILCSGPAPREPDLLEGRSHGGEPWQHLDHGYPVSQHFFPVLTHTSSLLPLLSPQPAKLPRSHFHSGLSSQVTSSDPISSTPFFSIPALG